MGKNPLLPLLALLLLAGCASTDSNYASKGVLLEDGSYYFAARDGQGDYYYAAPRRDVDYVFLLAHDRGPFWFSYCPWSSWHCPSWPHGYYPGFGYHAYFDPRPDWGWHGLHPDNGHGSRQRQHPPSQGLQPRPGRFRLLAGESVDPATGGEGRIHRNPGSEPVSSGRAERPPPRRERDDAGSRRGLSRPDTLLRPEREPGDMRIRERSHDRDD